MFSEKLLEMVSIHVTRKMIHSNLIS